MTNANATKNRMWARLGIAGAFALALGLTAVGCSSSAKHDAASTSTTVAPAISQSGTSAPSGNGQQQNGNQNSNQGSNQNSNQGNSNQNNGGGNNGGQQSGPSPVIVTFTTPDNIDCHNGNFQMFSASWTTQNAVKTTISIDGPGVYKTYGPNGSDSLPFNCSSSHSFLLTAYGSGGKTATKTITLQPRNVQSQGNGDTDTTDTTQP